VTYTPKWKFDAVLAAIVAAWFIGGRAYFRSVDLDVFLVQATAIIAFLFLSAAISVGPLSRRWPRATHFIYNRRHLGVATWALAVSHAAVVMHYGNSWKPANVLEVLPGQKAVGIPFTLLGVGALAILTVMALTSWDYFLHAWTPPAWKRLHMAVYVAYALIVFHFTVRFVGDPPVQWRLLALLWLVALAVAALHLAAALKEAQRDRPSPVDGAGLVFLGTFADLPEGKAATVPVDGSASPSSARTARSGPSPMCAHTRTALSARAWCATAISSVPGTAISSIRARAWARPALRTRCRPTSSCTGASGRISGCLPRVEPPGRHDRERAVSCKSSRPRLYKETGHEAESSRGHRAPCRPSKLCLRPRRQPAGPHP
jgi:DMSO/TMAO reductase YedYZ heme-binding membrane subunit